MLALKQPQKDYQLPDNAAVVLHEIYRVQISRKDPTDIRNFDYQAKIFQDGKHTCTLLFKERRFFQLQMEEKPSSYLDLAKLICFTGYLQYGEPGLEISVDGMDTEKDEPLKIARLMQKSKNLSKGLRVNYFTGYGDISTQKMRWTGKIKTISEPPEIKTFPVEGKLGDNKYFLDRNYIGNGYKINLEFGECKIEAKIDDDRKMRYLSVEGEIPDYKFAYILFLYGLSGKTCIPCQTIRVDDDQEKLKFMKKFNKKLGKVKITEYLHGSRLQFYAAGHIYSLPRLPYEGETAKKFLKKFKRF